jgi:transposase
MPEKTHRKVQRGTAEWRAIVARYERSGLPQAAFCTQGGIARHTFKKHYRQHKEAIRPAVPFVEVLPLLVHTVVTELQARLRELDERIAGHDRQMAQVARQNEATKRLMQVEGVGPLTATAVVATVGDAKAFAHGRQFAAWLGLVPKQFSTGGKPVLGRITKRGNVYLRTLLIHGARAVLQFTAKRTDAKSVWVEAVRQRRGDNIAAGALAAKHARILWALLAREQEYRLAA